MKRRFGPPPAGYIAWHDWAEAQTKTGNKQKKCPKCCRWFFPSEKHDEENCSQLREHAQPQGLESNGGLGADSPCTCLACIQTHDLRVDGIPLNLARMIVCPICGDKRCIHAKDHNAPCAKSDIYAHNLWVEKHVNG